jgi:peptide/nickel transport system substrate-binding protein
MRNAALGGAAAIGGPALLSGCGTSSSSSAANPGVVGKAKRGGHIIAGVSGGGANDNIDPHAWGTQIDGARVAQMYEWLSGRDENYNIVPFLATEFTYNSSNTEALVKLRPDVTFHNGKPLDSADVVASYHRILDPKVGSAVLGLFAPVIAAVEPVDKLTVRFKFKFPFTQLEDYVGSSDAGIIPVGWDAKHPIGTGPFKLESFTPGQTSVFSRYDGYWNQPLPYPDAVTILDLTDDSARVNALLSGAVLAIDSVPYSLIDSVKANPNVNVLNSVTGNWYPITMRVDQAPFNDPRVRQAMRWLINRPQLINDAYGGQARLGNDLYAIDDPLYAHDIEQREQDIDKAKFLLKQAGHPDGLTVNLVTAPIENGVVESCVVFAQQAKAAGVNVQITKLDNTTYYGSGFMKRTFAVDWWDAESFFASTAYTQTPDAAFPETHYNNPQFNKWYQEAVGTSDVALRHELAHNMQEQLWLLGGEIIPGFVNNIDGYSKKLSGFIPNRTGFNLNYWGFKSAYFV